jgi:hypothetical protein
MSPAPAAAVAAPPERRARPATELRRGVLPAVAAAVLAVIAAVVARWLPRGVLLVVLVPVQVLVAFCWLTLTAVPARVGGAAVASVTGVLGAAILTTQHPATLGALAGVVGLGVAVAILGQLVRRDRTQVTDALAAQCAAILLAAGIAALAASRGAHDGAVAAGIGLAALGAALLMGALVDAAARRTWLGPTASGRTLLGVLLSVGVAAGLGAILRGGDGAVLGAIAGVLAVLGDATVGVLAGPRRIARPLGVVLPFALLGPALFVATRVLFG